MPYSLITLSTTEPAGGLFDLNATLPLMAIQILILMVVLNSVFYKPVTNILDERNEYIKQSLTTAAENLKRANELTDRYGQIELAEARKSAQNIINQTKKKTQEEVTNSIKDVQTQIDIMILDASNELNAQKERALKNLEDQVDLLSQEIKSKLLTRQAI
uniref:ATP synthase CFO B' chain subunit II n=1 Tax=Porphyridium sordidum TaxID=28024 RepID=A0A1C9CDV6_PORSO|nr:ATP synthase CFO B' chain subunit II [Porphyridium sordidum]AOM66566.1 ATP synthase CFO B' chain subunit II [Porphyridium sordidum]